MGIADSKSKIIPLGISSENSELSNNLSPLDNFVRDIQEMVIENVSLTSGEVEEFLEKMQNQLEIGGIEKETQIEVLDTLRAKLIPHIGKEDQEA